MEPDADLLDAVQEEVYRLLVQHGVEEVVAIDEASTLRARLQKTHGGKEHYLPAQDKTARNLQILADLQAGLSPATVAEKHGVHPKTVEKIRAAARKRTGTDLGFGREDWVIR